MMRKVFLYIILISAICYSASSQDIFRLNTDTISSYDLLFQEAEDSLMVIKKKKKKKNVFFGIKININAFIK